MTMNKHMKLTKDGEEMIRLESEQQPLWQWDTGRRLVLTKDPAGTVVDFVQMGLQTKSAIAREQNGTVSVQIPNEMLCFDTSLRVYIRRTDEDNRQTVFETSFPVHSRPKPEDYISTEEEVRTWKKLEDRIVQLEAMKPVRCTPQSLTSEQQHQARENINAQPKGNYLTDESDPTVPGWAKQPSKPTYTAQEVGALSQNTLQQGIELALAQAKESGEFDGPQGPAGDVSGKVDMDGFKQVTPENCQFMDTNILAKGDYEVSGSGAYALRIIHIERNLKVGEQFSLLYHACDGNSASTNLVSVYLKKADGAQIRHISASGPDTPAAITIEASDLAAGADYVEFTLYPTQGTPLPAGKACYKGVVALKGTEKQIRFNDEAHKAIEKIADSSIARYQERSRNLYNEGTWVIGTIDNNGAFLQTVDYFGNIALEKYTEVASGERYTISFHSVAAAFYVFEYNDAHEFIRFSSFYGGYEEGIPFNTSPATRYLRFKLYSPSEPFDTLCPKNFMVEKGNKTPYIKPYVFSADNLNIFGIYQRMAEAGLIATVSPSLTIHTVSHRGRYGYGIGAMCMRSAVAAAKKQGYQYVENDVAVTKDGTLVMWHDATLGRLGTIVDVTGYALYFDTNGNPFWYDSANKKLYTYNDTSGQYEASSVMVNTLTKAAADQISVASTDFHLLRRIDFGKHWGFPGETIMTFGEWTLCAKELGMNIYVDFKITATDAQAKELVDTVRRYGMEDNVSWLDNFDLIRKYSPHARLGVLAHANSENVAANKKYLADGAFFYNSDGKTLTLAQAQLALEHGYGLECWYVDYEAKSESEIFSRIEELVHFGVQGISLDKYRIEEVMAAKYRI